MANWRSRDPTRASTVGTYPALKYRPGSWPREASINGIHPGLPGQLVRAALRSPEDHDASDLRRRLDHRWSIQVPTGLRRLIGSDDLGRGQRKAELVAAVVRLLEPNREREPRLFRHDDRRARIGLGVRPPPRIHAEGGVHGGLSFFFQAEDGIRDLTVTGVQTCALPI